MPATAWRKSSFSDDGGGSCVEVAWRKSSFSDGGGSSCVEVAWPMGGVAVRDSKNPDGGVLRLPVGAWGRLVAECSGAIDS
jgi:hypothetical protein